MNGKIERLTDCTPQFMHAMKQLMPQLTSESAAPEPETIQAIIKSASTSIWIAIDPRQEIVGMLTLAIYLTPTGIHAWIEDIVVDQKHRRQGYGEALTRRAIDYAREQSAKALSLTSRSERQAANRLYRSMGFNLQETNLYRMRLS